MNSAISSGVFGDASRLCEPPHRTGAAAPSCLARIRHSFGNASQKAQASRVTSAVTSIAALGAPWQMPSSGGTSG
jgi:hypothetical protein